MKDYAIIYVIMITKLKLHNWKSFRDATLFIDPLTFLIGTNASGKSNVLDAFDFLQRLSSPYYSLEDAIGSIRGGRDWIVRKGEKEFRLEVSVQGNDGVEQMATIEIGQDEKGFFYQTKQGMTEEVNSYLQNVFILNPKPDMMRGFSPLSKDLKSDGSNIAGVIANMAEDEKEALEKKLVDYVRPLPEKDIRKITAVKVGLGLQDAMLYCYEDWNPEQPVDARGMSDGTLRFVAIVVALLTAKPKSLLIIEEVDNGLHPSRAKDLVRVLREISAERSIDVLCTTHNSALMDELGNEMIPFVSFVKRDNDGCSQITLLEDKANLAKLMASDSIGSLMREDRL